MIITVKNNTQFPILLNGTLLPGYYTTMPVTPISPEKYTTYNIGSSTAAGAGTYGGNAWLVVLDTPGDTWSFATGCSYNGTVAPPHNKPRAGVAESSDPKDGNSAARLKGNSIISTDTFKDKDGKNIKFIASASFDETGTAVFTVYTTHASA
ncbi:hypothetical protein FRC05_002867 [Tulasnella sp. 425]|nr:hypothetical protein FRC05_002867 [Tulasnella sp. 425]